VGCAGGIHRPATMWMHPGKEHRPFTDAI